MTRYNVGDIVKMKKVHPCGGDQWEIMRTGVDFRIKCTKCGRILMLPRPKFEKSVKTIVTNQESGVRSQEPE
ncbi:MAG: DUF951 domain-containing protein [Firmicutes bacterium]|nr:DUF951 domain-containing protein [Bacillota bacterium]